MYLFITVSEFKTFGNEKNSCRITDNSVCVLASLKSTQQYASTTLNRVKSNP